MFLKMTFGYLLVCVLSLCLCAWTYLRWLRVRRYWAKRGVPHVSPHPLFGSLTALLRKHVSTWMREQYTVFPGARYVGAWLFWKPALIVNCPELARRVLVAESEIFRDRYLCSGKRDPLGSLNLFTVNDPIWTSMRRKLSPVFTSAKLRNLHGLISNKTQQLIKRLSMDKEQNKITDLRVVISDYTTDVISIAAFGVSSEATLTGTSPTRSVTNDFMQYSLYRGICWCSIFFMPYVTDIFGFTLFPKHSTNYLRKIYNTVVKERGGYEKATGQNKDLLDALLKIKKDALASGEEMHDDLLIAQATIFLQAGFDTTGTALAFAIYELAYAPQAQEKLYKELKKAELQFGGSKLDIENLSQLPYLNSVLKETMRKYPIMGWIDRVASQPFVVNENLTVDAGTPVFVNAMGLHFDPKLFPDPEKFIPDRFLPENECNIKPFTYMPFGLGPRHCIGERFAWNNMRSVLSEVCLQYHICPRPESVPAAKIKLEPRALFTLPAYPLTVNFEHRI